MNDGYPRLVYDDSMIADEEALSGGSVDLTPLPRVIKILYNKSIAY
jgi:hypothetical protein